MTLLTLYMNSIALMDTLSKNYAHMKLPFHLYHALGLYCEYYTHITMCSFITLKTNFVATIVMPAGFVKISFI